MIKRRVLFKYFFSFDLEIICLMLNYFDNKSLKFNNNDNKPKKKVLAKNLSL